MQKLCPNSAKLLHIIVEKRGAAMWVILLQAKGETDIQVVIE